jgi:hypothetical protein
VDTQPSFDSPVRVAWRPGGAAEASAWREDRGCRGSRSPLGGFTLKVMKTGRHGRPRSVLIRSGCAPSGAHGGGAPPYDNGGANGVSEACRWPVRPRTGGPAPPEGETAAGRGQRNEWLPDPVGCFAQKHGRFGEGACAALDEKKGAPKGKFEDGVNGFTATAGITQLEVQGAPSIKCTAATATGQDVAPNQLHPTVTYTGCEREKAKCSSASKQGGEIEANVMESYTYEEGTEYFSVIGGRGSSPFMQFSCSGENFILTGLAAGELKAPLNKALTSDEGLRRNRGSAGTTAHQPRGAQLSGDPGGHLDGHSGPGKRAAGQGGVGADLTGAGDRSRVVNCGKK